jgi:exopolysaccharide production protein ExoZ
MLGLTTMRLRSERSARSTAVPVRAGEPPGATKPRLNGVEAGRGVAALVVVFYHSALHVEGDVGGSVLWGLPHFGHAGVDFFFVLSGFIITFVHHQDIGTPGRLPHYIQRRFTRVLPFYWVVLAYYLADVWLLHPARSPGAWELVSNVFLLPQTADQIVGGAWTLVYELMFYGIFAVMVCSRRFGMAVLALWALLIAAGLIVQPVRESSAALRVASSPYCFEFFLGMGASYVLLRRRVPWSGVLLLAGLIGFLVAGVAETRGLLYGFGSLARVAYGVCSVVIIAALVERERSGLLTIPRPLAVLGRASYSVYLVHLVGLGVAFHIIARLTHPTVGWLLPIWFLLCVVGVAAGVLASIWVEQPLIKASRRWVNGCVAWAR